MSRYTTAALLATALVSLVSLVGCGRSEPPSQQRSSPLYELYTEADYVAAEKGIDNALMYPLKSINAQCDNVVVGADTITDVGHIGTLDLDVYCSPEQKTAIAQEGANQFFKMLPKFNRVRVSVYNYRTGGPENGVDEGTWTFDNPK